MHTTYIQKSKQWKTSARLENLVCNYLRRNGLCLCLCLCRCLCKWLCASTWDETAWRSPAKILWTSDSRAPNSLSCSLIRPPSVSTSSKQLRCKVITCVGGSWASAQRTCAWSRRKIANEGEPFAFQSTVSDTNVPPEKQQPCNKRYFLFKIEEKLVKKHGIAWNWTSHAPPICKKDNSWKISRLFPLISISIPPLWRAWRGKAYMSGPASILGSCSENLGLLCSGRGVKSI